MKVKIKLQFSNPIEKVCKKLKPINSLEKKRADERDETEAGDGHADSAGAAGVWHGSRRWLGGGSVTSSSGGTVASDDGEVSRGNWVAELCSEGWDGEVHAVVAVVGRGVVEGLGVGHWDERRGAVEEEDGVLVWNVAGWWLWAFVVGQGAVAAEGAVGGLGYVVHPPVETSGAVCAEVGVTWNEGGEVGCVDDLVWNGEVDESKGVDAWVGSI